VWRLIRNLPRPASACSTAFSSGPLNASITSTSTTPITTICQLRNRTSRAHARGHPDAGRRGETVHVMAFLASDNHTRAEKPDARHDSLDHTACVGDPHPTALRHPCSEGHTENPVHRAARKHTLRSFLEMAEGSAAIATAVAAMSDEQLDEALLPLREILAARAEAANVIEGSAEPVALPVPRRSPPRLRQSPSKNISRTA